MLQFICFTQRPGPVIAVDSELEMLGRAAANFEIAAHNDPVLDDGPCVFTRQEVFKTGSEQAFDEGRGHLVLPDVPLGVCDKTARWFRNLERVDFHVTDPTYHYGDGGCC